MCGHHPFIVTLVISTTLCSSMLTLITSGPSQFDKNQMLHMSSALSLLMSVHNFVFPLLLNGREYDTAAMRHFFSTQGTTFRLTCPYTSEQNGKAERILRTINDCIRTLLLHGASPLSYWAEALNTVTYLINRHPCRATGPVTPHHLLLDVPPRYEELRTFGCLCYPNTSATWPHKLSPRSVACVFLGYPHGHRGYHCYDIAIGRVYTSWHVTFVEHVFPFRDAAATTPTPALSALDAADDIMPATRQCRDGRITHQRTQQRRCPPRLSSRPTSRPCSSRPTYRHLKAPHPPRACHCPRQTPTLCSMLL